MKDIDQIRRENMAVLEKEAGGPTAAASRLGWDQPQWSNLRSGAADSKTGRPRGMRKVTARRIEAAFQREEFWLDTDHGANAANGEDLTANEAAIGLYVSPSLLSSRAKLLLVRKLEALDREGMLTDSLAETLHKLLDEFLPSSPTTNQDERAKEKLLRHYQGKDE